MFLQFTICQVLSAENVAWISIFISLCGHWSSAVTGCATQSKSFLGTIFGERNLLGEGHGKWQRNYLWTEVTDEVGDGGFDSAAWHEAKSVSWSDDFKTLNRCHDSISEEHLNETRDYCASVRWLEDTEQFFWRKKSLPCFIIIRIPQCFQSVSRKIIKKTHHLLISFISLWCLQSEWKWKRGHLFLHQIGHLSRNGMCSCHQNISGLVSASIFNASWKPPASVITQDHTHVTDWSWFKDTEAPFCFRLDRQQRWRS